MALLHDPGRQKREAVEVIADSVQFLAGREQASYGSRSARGSASSAPRDKGDFEAAPATPVTPAPVSDDDIPF